MSWPIMTRINTCTVSYPWSPHHQQQLLQPQISLSILTVVAVTRLLEKMYSLVLIATYPCSGGSVGGCHTHLLLSPLRIPDMTDLSSRKLNGYSTPQLIYPPQYIRGLTCRYGTVGNVSCFFQCPTLHGGKAVDIIGWNRENNDGRWA